MKASRLFALLLMVPMSLLLALPSSQAAETVAKSKHASAEEWAEALERMHALGRFQGPSVPGVDCSTLDRKVVVGYQGWHGAAGDGSGLGWRHYNLGKTFAPGSTCIDFWPDVSELGPDEKFPTPFKKADGSTAHVPSAFVPATVDRHCRWMKDYGIDAVFLQRFAHGVIRLPDRFIHDNQVLSNVRAGANAHGRGWVLMYDLSSVPADGLEAIKEDWRRLVDHMGVTKDPNDKAYLHHRGKPLVALWGVGMVQDAKHPGKRSFALAEQAKLIDFLRNDPTYGGNSIMIGLNNDWLIPRTKGAVADPALLDLIRTQVEVISPWSVGRYRDQESFNRFLEGITKDQAWCRQEQKDYLPVVFPGFSWHNKTPDAKLDQIPRQGGAFLWMQYAALKKLDIQMVYQAMFDEMDEGTQIFKVDQDPPVGDSAFLTYQGLPSDHYLWLVGQANEMLFGALPFTDTMPKR